MRIALIKELQDHMPAFMKRRAHDPRAKHKLVQASLPEMADFDEAASPASRTIQEHMVHLGVLTKFQELYVRGLRAALSRSRPSPGRRAPAAAPRGATPRAMDALRAGTLALQPRVIDLQCGPPWAGRDIAAYQETDIPPMPLLVLCPAGRGQRICLPGKPRPLQRGWP